MMREEFENEVKRLLILMPSLDRPDAKSSRAALVEELWRRFNAVPSATWASIVARVIDTHTRAGPPRPADFSAAEDYLREKSMDQSTVGSMYRPPTKAEAEDWCLAEIRTMKPIGARYVLALYEAGKATFTKAVMDALLEKAGEVTVAEAVEAPPVQMPEPAPPVEPPAVDPETLDEIPF